MVKNREGFTIIEVVLVLAIAGLIFLAVFLALPALQRAQRDQQRKTDLAIFKGAVDNWKINNTGHVIDDQTDLQQVKSGYFSSFKDPLSGQPYDLLFYPHTTSHQDITTPPLGTIIYVSGHICGSDANTYPNGTDTLITGDPALGPDHHVAQYSVLLKLENSNASICLDNH